MSSEGASAAEVNPRLGTLSPWLWVPPTLLFIYLLLWFSLKRDHFIETYYRLIDHIQSNIFTKVPCIPKRYLGSYHRVRLNVQDVEASLLPDDSDSDGEGAAATGAAFDDGDDELPPLSTSYASSRRVGTWHFAGVPLPPVRAATSQVLETLGWEGGVGRPSLTRALWGTRPQDRAGRIRLGEISSGEEEESRYASGAVGLGAMWHRVTDLAGGTRATAAAGAGYETIPSAAGAAGPVSHHERAKKERDLFRVEDEDEAGAVELPHAYQLPPSQREEQEMPEWKAGRA